MKPTSRLSIMTTGLGLAAAMSLGGSAHAANLLNNAGFEDPVGFDFSNITNWNAFFGGPPGTFLEAFNTTGAPAFEGAQSLELTIEGDGSTTNGNNAFTGHVQTVPGVIAGELYELSVYARNNNSQLTGVLEYRVEWKDAGGNEISRDQIEISGLLTDAYQPFGLQAVAPVGTTQASIVAAVATGDDTGLNNNHSVLLDAASFSVVPEPTSLALLGLGGLLAARRRR